MSSYRIRPNFFSIILIVSLIIGIVGNLISPSGVTIAITTILLFTTARFLADPLNHLAHRHVKIGISIGFVLMLIFQIYVLVKMPTTFAFDAFRIIPQAEQLAAGHPDWHITYFWRYANNIPIVFFLSIWLRLTHWIGLTTNLSIHLLSLIILNAFVVLTLRTIWSLSKRNSLLIAGFGFFALTPFAYTYYLQVFYSDLPNMLLLVIILRILLFWPRYGKTQRIWAGIGLTLTVLLGNLLKPNLIVLLIALAILLIILISKKLFTKSDLLLPTLLIVFGFVLSAPATPLIYSASHYTPKTEYALPPTNWIVMGLNASQGGRYADEDVVHASSLPNKAARQKDNLKEISHRLKTLGPSGLIRLWQSKLRTLLNVGGIQNWYSMGFRSAPRWYYSHARTLRILCTISYTAATLVMWLFLILRLLTWRPNLSNRQDVITLLAIITTLGYLAFHTLVWETESRYGQAILPLTWFVLAALPAPKKQSQSSRFDWVGTAWLISTLLIATSFSSVLGKSRSNNELVSGQQGQMTDFYGARPTTIKPGTVIKQKITLNSRANYFAVQVRAGSSMKVILKNQQTHQSYVLNRSEDSFIYSIKQAFAASNYQLEIINNTQKNQLIDITKTRHYRLAKYPVQINNRTDHYGSLIYRFNYYEPAIQQSN